MSRKYYDKITLGTYLTKVCNSSGRCNNCFLCKCRRSAVVPFVVNNGEIHFLFGIDQQSGEITDFGGGIKKNEIILESAIREFKEETKEIFEDTHITVEDLLTLITLIGKSTCTVFYPLGQIWFTEANRIFQSVDDGNMPQCNMEVSGLVWLTMEDILKVSNDGLIMNGVRYKMWKRLAGYYRRNIDNVRHNLLMRHFS